MLKRIYGLKEYVGWRIPKWLFCVRLSLICKWDDFSYFWVSMLPKRLPSSFCSREYIVWKKMFVEEFQDGSLVHGHCWCVNEMILASSEYPYCWKPLIKFLLKKIYGLEDVDWRIPRWLFSAWASLMWEWVDFSFFWVSILQKAFHQFFWSRAYLVGRRCWLKNIKMAV